MLKATTRLPKSSRCVRPRYSSALAGSRALPPKINTLSYDLNDVPLELFRDTAFVPGKPIHIAPSRENDGGKDTKCRAYPAQEKWFCRVEGEADLQRNTHMVPAEKYLSQFADTILPYELTLDLTKESTPKIRDAQDEMSQVIASLLESSPNASFHRFNAPLSLFLQAYTSSVRPRKLYIAQAQIADLPKQLQDDLPVPRIVQDAGKGDIYDSNIWMGMPPTYTPLHKDPNPNLFVQLVGRKVIRLFKPDVGLRIFRTVQERIGQHASSVFRGEEMMEGPERDALDKAVWGGGSKMEVFEAIVHPGEALFIPKGWWHSIKSAGPDLVNASVNWWFR